MPIKQTRLQDLIAAADQLISHFEKQKQNLQSQLKQSRKYGLIKEAYDLAGTSDFKSAYLKLFMQLEHFENQIDLLELPAKPQVVIAEERAHFRKWDQVNIADAERHAQRRREQSANGADEPREPS